MLWMNLGLFILSCILLVVFGTLLVRMLTLIARFLRINEFVAAFFLMAVSTSLPELFVGISSALANNPALALGTVIGSNIADLTLVAGIAIILSRGVRIKQKSIRKDALLMVFIAALPVLLFTLGNELSRVDGALLLLVFFLYSLRLYAQRKQFVHTLGDHISRIMIVASIFFFMISLVGLFYSSKYVVTYGILLAHDMGAPTLFIGLFFLALGTSLPELVFETQALFKRHTEMGLGDLIGSVIFNSTGVLGITALITPITNQFFLFITSSAFMIILAFLFATFVEVGSKLTVKEGICLILFYALFLLIELNLRSPVFQTIG